MPAGRFVGLYGAGDGHFAHTADGFVEEVTVTFYIIWFADPLIILRTVDLRSLRRLPPTTSCCDELSP